MKRLKYSDVVPAAVGSRSGVEVALTFEEEVNGASNRTAQTTERFAIFDKDQAAALVRQLNEVVNA